VVLLVRPEINWRYFKELSMEVEERKTGKYELPWVEKYRPKRLSDVVGNEEVVERLKVNAKHGNMTNLLLTGPPGCGKTTAVMCLAREMLGEELLREAILELNASDERGIDVIRSRVKMFAQKKLSLPPGAHKIIILDEADSMTPSAQQALRRTMEIYSATTRFALACNLSNKVIEPIQSRCAVVRFQRLTNEQVTKRLLMVLEAEGVPFEPTGIEALVFTAEGDMRNALNNTQSTFHGFGRVTADNVFKVCDQPHPLVLKQFIAKCLAVDLDGAISELRYLWKEGYSAIDIIQTVFRIAKSYDMSEEQKLGYLREVGMTHMRIANGVDSMIQLSSLAARLCEVRP